MSQSERRARRAGKVVLQLYKQYDPLVAERAEEMGVTCKEGCAHCCMLPATATVPEMILVVDHLASRSDWPKRRPALERELARQLAAFAAIDVLDERQRKDFFDRQMPCAFLTADHRCEIYTLRPAACRYHMVVSDPKNCALGAKEPTTARVNLRQIEDDVMIRAAEEYGELVGGCIALAFVLAADLLGVKLDIDRKLLDRVQISRVAVPKKDLVGRSAVQ